MESIGRHEATAPKRCEGQPWFARVRFQAHQPSGSEILGKLYNVKVRKINNKSKGRFESFDVLQWI